MWPLLPTTYCTVITSEPRVSLHCIRLMQTRQWLWITLQKKVRVFVGTGTIWHEHPHFKRPGTEMESFLSEKHAQYLYATKEQ